ncbi:hypothetical protein C9374_010939 [Naegleria lovaniensis]|uniref:Uncharacterized protein n=1 Tax=Naegleria lovaniensis TaxID=51637 RepID=A0AA88GGW8_NAELO|nr:uncharacterized protein C9374_010939 [Naegleria lovaniensis]KAG2374369.1 hypothetical protein C9374_010939 [Naegleria lovaniensis]
MSLKEQQTGTREEFVLEMIDHVKPRIVSNYFVVNDRPFPIVAPEDIIEKENLQKCSFCYLHAEHTPCGQELKLMTDCQTKHGLTAEINPEKLEDVAKDPCFPIFASHFFPCFNKIESHPYYYFRSNILFGLGTKNLLKTWFDIQKFNALSYLNFRRGNTELNS